ncbi:MAG: LytTR family DNA-binding domain-containing protein [Chitinophagaceae bacterium]|jgi:DNA-binding LytR/AlgR family response regulator|nr:LytTR family DNA-binding domain-containing protein [Chitinophagaceae bacterium]
MQTCIIIEDERHAALFLQEQLAQVAPDMQVLAMLESVEEALVKLPALRPDLVLADIQLEDGLSFTIFERLQWRGPVVFITAYDAYAIRAFKINGIDYLLKPCNEAELAAAIRKYRQQAGVLSQETLLNLLKTAQMARPAFKERFAVQLGARIWSVPVGQVGYFYFSNRVTYLVTLDGQRLPMHDSLDAISAEVDPALFFRVNRSYLVQHGAIERIESHAGRNILLMLQPASPEGSVAVSKDRIAEFKSWLNR